MRMLALAVALALGVGAAAPAFAKDCASELTAVKTAWDKTAPGAKKDDALKHYQAAEKAHKAKDEKTCLAEVDLARAALK